jgi:hypothetical protein
MIDDELLLIKQKLTVEHNRIYTAIYEPVIARSLVNFLLSSEYVILSIDDFAINDL